MQQIQTIENKLPAQSSLTPDIFTRFVNWIDRSPATARTYIINLRQFVAWLRYAAIIQPCRADIIAYREYLSSEHEAIQIDGNGWKYRTDSHGNRLTITCKPNTVVQYMRSVCQFFRWTVSEGLYPDIASNIRLPNVNHATHRKDALTAAEVQQIECSILNNAASMLTSAAAATKDTAGRMQRITEQGKRIYAMYLLTVTAGLRTIELSRANIKDLETKNGCTWLYVQGKGHTEPDTKKAIPPAVYAAIQDYLQCRNDSSNKNRPLFTATGNRSHGKRLAATTISTMLKQAMQTAGYDSERLTAHSLRHTAGTAVMELTGNIYQTQQYMRHSNPATTEIYLHVNQEEEEQKIAQQLYDSYHKF